jgi:RHH-type transcriptional regulator, rel operon repressor / antitoxin RelB
MPHLLRFSRDLEARLDTLAEATGLGKAELITRCVEVGVAALEDQLLPEQAVAPVETRSIDQVLRESGLGA